MLVTLLDGTGNALTESDGLNNFSYSFQIDSISPKTGGFFGETLLTITGKNFLPGDG